MLKNAEKYRLRYDNVHLDKEPIYMYLGVTLKSYNHMSKS